MAKLTLALEQTRLLHSRSQLPDVAIAGGVSANSGLRQALEDAKVRLGWNIFIPPLQYSTDNAAMIGVLAERKLSLQAEATPADADILPNWALA